MLYVYQKYVYVYGEQMTTITIDTNNLKCPCGKPAHYVCDCGCLCCGEDPCAFGCGGSVLEINRKRILETGIRVII